MFDNLIALIFIGNKVDLELGLPPELKEISVKKYPEVRGRVIAFNTAVRFDRSVELVLSADDINVLYAEVYLEYLRRPIKHKAFESLDCFDIKNNEVLISEISPFLFFTSNKSLINRRAVKFAIENGKLIEYRRFITVFSKNIDNSEYQLVKKGFSSGLIHFIIGSQTTDSRNSLQSIRKKIGKEPSPIIKNLKSIRAIDNKLILQS
ncbi:hypothetical protein [Calothrix sp. CCY 0018]|uniref:hypothetical protein n=1 Tax=Calothrix sp. CCY 0018 TaxID=3103864 RepID=UPI0039C65DA2